nr:hypothetical protein CFP56_07392 [Quercus suber]
MENWRLIVDFARTLDCVTVLGESCASLELIVNFVKGVLEAQTQASASTRPQWYVSLQGLRPWSNSRHRCDASDRSFSSWVVITRQHEQAEESVCSESMMQEQSTSSTTIDGRGESDLSQEEGKIME